MVSGYVEFQKDLVVWKSCMYNPFPFLSIHCVSEGLSGMEIRAAVKHRRWLYNVSEGLSSMEILVARAPLLLPQKSFRRT